MLTGQIKFVVVDGLRLSVFNILFAEGKMSIWGRKRIWEIILK